jgi:folylpolyglutamate synthase/dihydropteroate synthase
LARALEELAMHDFPLVLGASRGKRVAPVLAALAALRPRPLFTRIPDGGIEPGELLRAWTRIASGGRVQDDIERALGEAAAIRRRPEQPVVVAGSLYLVGAVRGMLLGERSGE